jgi:hypothetical protein
MTTTGNVLMHFDIAKEEAVLPAPDWREVSDAEVAATHQVSEAEQGVPDMVVAIYIGESC